MSYISESQKLDRLVKPEIKIELGWEDGEVCGRTIYTNSPCKGIIQRDEPDDGCSCHICPPCSSCVTPWESCPVCGWAYRLDEENLP